MRVNGKDAIRRGWGGKATSAGGLYIQKKETLKQKKTTSREKKGNPREDHCLSEKKEDFSKKYTVL